MTTAILGAFHYTIQYNHLHILEFILGRLSESVKDLLAQMVYLRVL